VKIQKEIEEQIRQPKEVQKYKAIEVKTIRRKWNHRWKTREESGM